MSTTVLFDAPGPRARRRHAILTAVGIVVSLGLVWVVLRKMGEANQLNGYMWEPFITSTAWTQYLIPGLIGTFKAAVISVVLAGIFGVVFGMGRLSSVTAVRWTCGVVVEFFRAVPVLMMMVFAYFGIYTTTGIVSSANAPLAAVVTGLTLYNGSVIAELIRSGVYALPKGQNEAGLSIGLTSGQTLRIVLLPQALTAMLPALISQFVTVIKDSALGYGITYLELLSWSKTLGSAYANTVPAYIVAAVLFIIINYSLTRLAGWVETRLKRSGSTAGPVTSKGTAFDEGEAEPGDPSAHGARRVARVVDDLAEDVMDRVDELGGRITDRGGRAPDGDDETPPRS